MIPIHLAVEDTLSEQILRRLLAESGRNFEIASVISRGGFGYLKTRIPAFNSSAKALPFLVLTDLDSAVCPPALIQSWLPGKANHNLLFRVAVREVEAWILGDHLNFSAFLRASIDRMPAQPETLPDPKRTLIDIAKTAKADVRRRLVPRASTTAKVGPEYNACLSEFVARLWNPAQAASRCPSLAKCMARIAAFQPSQMQKA